MIQRSRTVSTAQNGAELGAHGTGLLPVAAYDNDYTEREAAWHWHRELELIRVAEGRLRVLLPGEQVLLNSGELLFINSGVMHAAANGGEGACLLHSVVFLPEFLCNGTEGIFWRKYLGPLVENAALPSVRFPGGGAHTAQALAYMDRFWEACREEPFGYEFLLREQLSGVLRLLAAGSAEAPLPDSPRRRREDERVKVMLAYIQENYASEITARTLAAQASISESECQRCFRDVLGTTPIQYVKKYRLQMAADLLTATDCAVTEIALRCGFAHMSYFARAFRELFGLTPREYRRRAAGEPQQT